MKLSDTQLILLSKAAKRDDRALQLPSNIDVAAAEKLVSKLAGAGLIEEIETIGSMPVWRRMEDEAFALRVTDAGLKAIGVDEMNLADRVKQKRTSKDGASPSHESKRSAKPIAVKRSPKPKGSKTTKKAKAPKHRSGTKHDQILDLLRRKGGASIAEMQKVSGWQPHSVRGFMSGTVKKRLGLKLSSTVSEDGERHYTIKG